MRGQLALLFFQLFGHGLGNVLRVLAGGCVNGDLRVDGVVHRGAGFDGFAGIVGHDFLFGVVAGGNFLLGFAGDGFVFNNGGVDVVGFEAFG